VRRCQPVPEMPKCRRTRTRAVVNVPSEQHERRWHAAVTVSQKRSSGGPKRREYPLISRSGTWPLFPTAVYPQTLVLPAMLLASTNGQERTNQSPASFVAGWKNQTRGRDSARLGCTATNITATSNLGSRNWLKRYSLREGKMVQHRHDPRATLGELQSKV